MRRYILIFFLFFSPFVVFAEGIQQATYILEKVTRFHKNHPKIMGNFNLSVNGQRQTGIFYYLSTSHSQSVKLFFGPEDVPADSQGRYSYWVVDKNKLWIYLSDSNVLVEQEIPEYFNTIGILGSGLSHYFASYKKFSMEEVTEKNNQGEEIVFNRLKFSEPVKVKSAFIEMTVDITEDGFQRATRAISVTGEGKKKKSVEFSFVLSNIDTDASYNEKQIFKITPGNNTQILRNVLMN